MARPNYKFVRLRVMASSSGKGLKPQLAAAGSSRSRARLGDQALALGLFARSLARSANGLARLPSSFFGRLFVGAAALHFAKQAFALKFLLQDPQGLVDIVVSYGNSQGNSPFKWVLGVVAATSLRK